MKPEGSPPTSNVAVTFPYCEPHRYSPQPHPISEKYTLIWSIPDGVIGIFHWHNASDRTMVLGSTQPLTEMSTRSISWG